MQQHLKRNPLNAQDQPAKSADSVEDGKDDGPIRWDFSGKSKPKGGPGGKPDKTGTLGPADTNSAAAAKDVINASQSNVQTAQAEEVEFVADDDAVSWDFESEINAQVERMNAAPESHDPKFRKGGKMV